MKIRYFEVTGSIQDVRLVIFRANKLGKARAFLNTLQTQKSFSNLGTREIICGMHLRTGLVFDKASSR